MTNYTRGRAYEYKVKKQLEKEGWMVLRTAGSHGEFDLVALHEVIKCICWKVAEPNKKCPCPCHTEGEMPRIKLIQCKTGKSKKQAISEVEKSDIKKYEGLYSVSVEVI